MTNQDSNPSSWLSLQLGQVIDYGQTEKVEPDNISSQTWVLELEDIERDTSRLLKRLTYAERPSKSTKNSFSPGDVLYGKLRPYLNKVIYADTPGVCSTEIIPLKPNLAVDSRYLFHWIRHPEFLAYTSQVSHGVNMPRLGTEAGRQAPFILAPINEQRRIADKLDRVLARVDAANEHLSRVAPLIKRFRQSVLSSAISGKLTEEWRKTNKESKKWKSTPLGKSAKFIDYRGKTPTKTQQGIPLITAKNVRQGFLSYEPREFINPSDHEKWMTRGLPEPGDVLITTEAPLGNVTLIDWDYKFALAQRLICLHFSKEILGKFAAFQLQSPNFQRALNTNATGSTVTGIQAARLKELEIIVPSLEEQSEIVRRVEKLFTFADRLEERLSQAQAAVQKLTPALLAKAFRGELVPQDPNDEPANELLRRLQESRTESTKPGRARKPRTKKSP